VPGLDPAPYPAPSLATLCGTKPNYLIRFELATWQSTLEGFLLPEDIREVIELAREANVPEGFRK